MGKTKDDSKPATVDKVANKMDKAVDKFMDKTDKVADKFADKMDNAKLGAEDKVVDKFTNKMDKVVDKFTDKVEKIADKAEPNASEDQDVAWYQYGGEGVAVGKNTFTEVETTSKIVDSGHVTTAKININVTAVAEGGSTYASADTYFDSNSDISLLIKFEEGSLEYDGVSYDISNAKYIGIYLPDDINLSGGPKNKVIVIEGDGDPEWDPALDGNIATLSFNAEVSGDNTYLSADAYVMSVEDRLSISAITMEAAVS